MPERTAAPSGDEAPPEDEDGIEEAPRRAFDLLDVYIARRTQPRSLRRLPQLAASALGIARAASPRLFAVVVGLSLVTALLLGVQVLLGKLAIERILTEASGDGRMSRALPPVVALVVASALSGVAGAAQTQLQRLLAERVQLRMWSSIVDVTTSVPLATFESPEFFDELQRVRTNGLSQPTTMTQGLIGLISGLLAVTGVVVALLLIAPVLIPIFVVGAVPLWLVTRRSSRLEFEFAVDQTPRTRLRHYLIEVLSGRSEAKEVRAFDLGAVLAARWRRVYDDYLADFLRHIRTRIGLALAGALVTVVVTSVAVGLLLVMVFEGDLAVASAGAALIAVRLLAGRLQAVFSGIGSIFEASLFLADYEQFCARRPPPHPGGAEAVAPFEEVRLDGVSFRYPGSDRDVLRDVSLSIRRGETVALVGENGSGKTTLAKVLGRLFEPTDGRVLWDGRDTAELDPDAVRRHVGVIFQDFIRYQLSARENVGFGRAEAVSDLDGIRRAAKAAGADRFLGRLPEGYETGLGKEFFGGYDLSLGQWQRVALARAFFRDAAFLILDEPTASLDARSEHELFEFVRTLAQGRSLLLISHRFSTVMSADRIDVLHDGEVVEQGSHTELMALGGRYAELFELQARSYR